MKKKFNLFDLTKSLNLRMN